MYRSGIIDGDDEVAVLFNPETFEPLCEPLVNIRHAIERLANPGTISRDVGRVILRVAQRLPYAERSYRRILKAAGLEGGDNGEQLLRMLASHDLKREDAVSLLECLRQERAHPVAVDQQPVRDDPGSLAKARGDHVHCWEFGPPLPFSELLEFLALTGALSRYGRRAALALGTEAARSATEPCPQSQLLLERLFARTARTWHWTTKEEVLTSLADLGVLNSALEKGLTSYVELEARAMEFARSRSELFCSALAVELFLDDLALKREAARALSLRWLAERGKRLGGPGITPTEIRAAAEKLCQKLDVRDLPAAIDQLGWWGVAAESVSAFVSQLALARRACVLPVHPQFILTCRPHPWLRKCLKAPGSRRFCVPVSRAYAIAKRLQPVIGVTRVAVITRLGTIGIPNAQAFRPNGEWSSTVGSGKSTSTTGARVGALMEEAEKWAQEEFTRGPRGKSELVSSFDSVGRDGLAAVDPATLDLPYDTCYESGLEIGWHWCVDLAGGGRALLPTAAIVHRRVPNDIYYSQRGGRKILTTNGLASGMTIAEALTHGLCEYIERHARTVELVECQNPGGPNAFGQRPFLDLETVPRSAKLLIAKIHKAGYHLRVQVITCNIAVPVFSAMILLPEGSPTGILYGDGLKRATGWAAHPDPETALTMAILEASQSIMTHVAGSREDLVLRSRSLGRHERTGSQRRSSYIASTDADAPHVPFDAIRGLTSNDAAEDVRWICKQLRKAGYSSALIADYSCGAIEPVKVIRAIIPGLETLNPFHTGWRARAALLCDLLPPRG